jgi:hypothetical protein
MVEHKSRDIYLWRNCNSFVVLITQLVLARTDVDQTFSSDKVVSSQELGHCTQTYLMQKKMKVRVVLFRDFYRVVYCFGEKSSMARE